MSQPIRKSATVQQSSLGAVSAKQLINVANATDVAVDISGTFVGTVTFEASIDGVSFAALGVSPASGAAVVTTATAAGLFGADVSRFKVVQVRCSAWTSGAIVVKSIRAIR